MKSLTRQDFKYERADPSLEIKMIGVNLSSLKGKENDLQNLKSISVSFFQATGFVCYISQITEIDLYSALE